MMRVQSRGMGTGEWQYVLDQPTRILFVDDDPIIREFATVNLSTPLASVETAANGQLAYDRLLQDRFDLALIDIEMPGLNGFELTRRIRAHPRLSHLPVVMVTGREDVSAIDQAFQAGATSFVAKPVNWRLLSHQLRYVLRMSEVERQVRADRDKAVELSSLKNNLLNMLRHEVRTPLSAIIGFARLIAGECKPPERCAEYALQIEQSGNALLRDLIELLNYSQLTSQIEAFAFEPLDLSEVIDRARSQAAGDQRVEVSVPTVTVYGEADQLSRMFAHLISNALAYGGGDVRVFAEVDSHKDLRIHVRDNGSPLAPEAIDAWLEPFTQRDSGLTRVGRGFGIGLPASRRIAQLHDGTLELTSGDEGTTATVTLPAHRVKCAQEEIKSLEKA